MMRRLAITALFAAVTVGLSGMALAQNDNDKYKKDYDHKSDHDKDWKKDKDKDKDGWKGTDKDHDWDRDHHWRDGDRDRDDRWRDHDKDRDDRWRNGSGWYGNGPASYPSGNYPYGYPNYPSGNYPSGYPGRTYPTTSYPYGGWGAGNANNYGYRQGYQDGSLVAREDLSSGKPYNNYPRGDYKYSDHGYQSGYGNKGTYQEAYLHGYEAGYSATRGSGFGRR